MELTRFKTTIKTLPARFGKALYVLFEMFCEVIGILAFCATDSLPLKAYSKWPGRCKHDLGHVRDFCLMLLQILACYCPADIEYWVYF